MILRAVINEAALRREVGGRNVMHAQTQRIVDLAQLPNVTIQVLPFGVGAHPAMLGAFTALRFLEEPMNTVYIEPSNLTARRCISKHRQRSAATRRLLISSRSSRSTRTELLSCCTGSRESDEMEHLTWHVSSYSSGQGGNCVEVAKLGQSRLIRDSKDRAGPILVLGAAEWVAFAAAMRVDKFG